MKKMISLVLGILMLLSLAACGNSSNESEQIPDPFAEYTSMEEAAQAAGFDLSVPDSIDGLEKTAIRVDEEGKLFEVIYGGEDEKIVIRKAEGNEDVSGDYTEYGQINTVSVANSEITMKGNNDKVNVAIWTNGDYSYSITSSAGLKKTEAVDLINSVDSGTGDVHLIGGDPATWGPDFDSDEKTNVEIADPFTECASMDEAAACAGFPLTVPETMNNYSERIIRVMDGENNFAMIEVIYCNDDENGGTDEESEIRIRKATGNEDISGDYTDYSENSTVTVENISVSVKGDNGRIRLVTWKNDNYTYSIGFYFDAGISIEDLKGFITSVQ